MSTQSDKVNELAVALVAAQQSLGVAKIDADNPFFNSRYATLNSVWDAARKVLPSNGLAIAQTFEASDGRVMNITTTLLHVSGQWIRGTLSMAPQQANPQGIGSAVTYGRRYALASLLGIVCDEDDDGNQASHKEQPPTAYKRTVTQPTAKPISTPPLSTKPAEKAIETQKNTGSGDWRSVVVHFGKKKGVALGELEERSLLWYIQSWQPTDKPNYPVSPQDVALRKALDTAGASMALPGFGIPEQVEDEIPGL